MSRPSARGVPLRPILAVTLGLFNVLVVVAHTRFGAPLRGTYWSSTDAEAVFSYVALDLVLLAAYRGLRGWTHLDLWLPVKRLAQALWERGALPLRRELIEEARAPREVRLDGPPAWCTGLIALTCLIVYGYVAGWTTMGYLGNESSLLSNVVLELALAGEFHYPLHAQQALYPGIEVFCAHPPLQYLLAAASVAALGVGVAQITLISFLTGLACVVLVVACARRGYGVPTAYAAAGLCGVCYGLKWASRGLRSDLLWGFLYAVFLVVLADTWRRAWRRQPVARHSVGLGALAALLLAAHWNGVLAFAYLGLHALVTVALSRKSWWREWLRGLTGVGLVIVPWVLLYQGEFLDVFRQIFLEGASRFRYLAANPFSNTFGPLKTWDGGGWILAGIAALLAFRLASLVGHVLGRRGDPPSQPVLLDVFLLGNLALYLLFYWLAVKNYHPQYLANIYPLLLLAGARGWGLLFGLTRRVFGARWAPRLGLAVLATALLTTPSVRDELGTWPGDMFTPNARFHATRARLGDWIEPADTVFVGAPAYPYVHDRTVHGIYEAEARAGSTWPAFGELTLEQRREQAALSGEVMLMLCGAEASYQGGGGDYNWQDSFLIEAVWRDTFAQIGAVFVEGQGSLGVFYRRDLLARRAPTGDVPSVEWSDGVGRLAFAPSTPRSGIVAKAWAAAGWTDQCRELTDVLRQQRWFGRPPQSAFEEDAYVLALREALVDHIERFYWRPRSRTLEQALEFAMFAPAVRSVWLEIEPRAN